MADKSREGTPLRLIATDGVGLDRKRLRTERGYDLALKRQRATRTARGANRTTPPTPRPILPNLILFQGGLVKSHMRLVAGKPQLKLVIAGEKPKLATDARTATSDIGPPPDLEMFTDEQAARHGGETSMVFDGIVNESLGDIATIGAGIIANEGKKEGE